MKRAVLIVLLAFAGLSVTACSSSESPSDVVKKFWGYVEKGETGAAYEHLTSNARMFIEGFGGGRGGLSDQTKKIQEQGGIKSMEVKSEEITGDTAVVKLMLSYGNGETDEELFKLAKEEGEWKIDISK